jgi:hypothetical protein
MRICIAVISIIASSSISSSSISTSTSMLHYHRPTCFVHRQRLTSLVTRTRPR